MIAIMIYLSVLKKLAKDGVIEYQDDKKRCKWP